jgi:hypothetical protein
VSTLTSLQLPGLFAMQHRWLIMYCVQLGSGVCSTLQLGKVFRDSFRCKDEGTS